jgi:hypothetical protein
VHYIKNENKFGKVSSQNHNHILTIYKTITFLFPFRIKFIMHFYFLGIAHVDNLRINHSARGEKKKKGNSS